MIVLQLPLDGTYAKTAIFLSPFIVCQPRKTTVRFPFANGSLQFPFSVCRKQTEVAVFRKFCFLSAEFRKHGSHRYSDLEMETWKHGNMGTSNGNGRPGDFLNLLQFAHRGNGSLSFVGLLPK